MAGTRPDRRRVRLLTLMLAAMLSLVGVVGGVTATAVASPDPDAKIAAKTAHASATSDAGVLDICNYTTARPTIRRGSTGAAVRQAQCYVYWSVAAADLEFDGIFGPITDHWIRVFQGCAGITVDGIVGPQTWSYLTYWANAPGFVC